MKKVGKHFRHLFKIIFRLQTSGADPSAYHIASDFASSFLLSILLPLYRGLGFPIETSRGTTWREKVSLTISLNQLTFSSHCEYRAILCSSRNKRFGGVLAFSSFSAFFLASSWSRISRSFCFCNSRYFIRRINPADKINYYTTIFLSTCFFSSRCCNKISFSTNFTNAFPSKRMNRGLERIRMRRREGS